MKYPLILLLIYLFTSCTNATLQETSDNRTSATVEVRKVSVADATEIHRFTGIARAELSSHLSFPIQGRLEKMHVNDGSFVESSQLLAQVDDLEFQNNYQIAEASFQQISDQYQRLLKVYESGSLTERDFVEMKHKYTQAKAHRDIASKRLNDTRMLAPFSGKILKLTTDIGSIVNPGNPIYQLVKFDIIKCEISIPENKTKMVRVGSTAFVKVPALSKEFSGRVASIAPVSEPSTHTYKATIIVANKDLEILPGMVTICHVSDSHAGVLPSIPITSLVPSDEKNYAVFLYDPGTKKVKQQNVELMNMKGNLALIKTGLQEGDLIITKGQHALNNGQEVLATIVN